MGNSHNLTGKVPTHENIDTTVKKRYAVSKRIGRGCYGVVFQGHKISKEGKKVVDSDCAIKKIMSAFRNANDAQRVYREVMYLRELQGHENIVVLREVINAVDDRHLYLIFELMDSSLHMALRVKALQTIHKPYIIYQIMRGLKFIHSAGIMHRDLTPANLLLSKSSDCKIADFGWARTSPASGEEDAAQMSSYTGTRWYRCPEIVFDGRYYTTSIDVWAAGCIAGELYADGPLLPGTSTIDMTEKMIELLGKPTDYDIVSLNAPDAEVAMEPVAPGPAYNGIEKRFPQENQDMQDFMHLLMQWDPSKRLTASEALTHPFLGAHHNPDDEPTFGRRVELPLGDDEQVSHNWYRDQIYADIIGSQHAKAKLELHRRQAKEGMDWE